MTVPGAPAERLRRVRDQVRDDQAELRRVPVDEREVAAEPQVEDRALREGRAEQVAHPLGDDAQVERRRGRSREARAGEQAAGEVRGPARRELDELERAAQGRARGEVGEREARVPEDPDQEIVDLVGETAGQGSEALEPQGVEPGLPRRVGHDGRPGRERSDGDPWIQAGLGVAVRPASRGTSVLSRSRTPS